MDQAGSKLLRGLLEVFLLESLEREPKHGYAALKELADAFGVEPNRNRLYPLLGRLVKEGLVHELSEGDGGRTIYGLTEEGRTQLEAYRRLPRTFRDTLERVWRIQAAPPEPGTPAGAAAAADAPAAAGAAASTATAAASTETVPRAVPIAGVPVSPMAPPPPLAPRPPPAPVAPAAAAAPAPTAAAPAAAVQGGVLPYPCPDARISVSKDPRTGDLGMTLSGCPMGAYEYCGKCPVFHAVDGLRRVVFSI